ncbi:MAG: hypothetical protein ABW352_22870 [Polyangiales bacterium]
MGMTLQPQRGFKLTLTVVGVVYTLMACSMLVRGPTVLHEFGVSPRLTEEAVLRDFFSFFYQLMAAVGVLVVLMGHTVRERAAQRLVAAALGAANLLAAWRDLTTSDSDFGSRLYHGPKTMVFVYISLTYALIFAILAISAGRAPRT